MPAPDHHGFLRLLAESLATSLADGGDSALVHVVLHPDGPDVGILPLEGMAPAEYLLGAVAPPEWDALGAITRGRARPLDGPGPTSTAEVVVIVPRVGEVVGRLRFGQEVSTEPPAYGLTLDCMQRALGLPTAPPQESSAHYMATFWLEAVLRAAEPAEVLGTLHAGLKWDTLGWERLRQLVATGALADPTLSPEDAAWFDEGGFARWVLTGRRTLAALLNEVAETIGPAEARHCAGVLADMGIDVSVAPPARRDRRRRRAG